MNTETEPSAIEPDSAAVFACALSLWQACRERAAGRFEAWACEHINFDELEEPWPYLLEDHFGETCLQVLSPGELVAFGDRDCLRVAVRMRLPVRLDQNLPVAVDVRAAIPALGGGSEFREFRIQTIRDSLEEEAECVVFTAADDPFDPEFGPPYFSLYGVKADGVLEHIADRPTWPEAVRLAGNLWPGVEFQG